MLKQSLNELEIVLHLKTTAPLLIKDGRLTDDARKDWSGQDKKAREKMPMAVPISRSGEAKLKEAVKSADPLAQVATLEFYVPATSLRGAWRSHLERVLRGLDPADRPRVCDPLAVGKRQDVEDEDEEPRVSATDASCSHVLEEAEGASRYALSCPVCKLFGSTVHASRLAISDGRLLGKAQLTLREHVRINRHTGQVAGAPLKFMGLHPCLFEVTLRLRNFEIWQVFLAGMLLESVVAGLVPVGSGKNKGYGSMRGEVKAATLTAFGMEKPDDVLRGIGERMAGDGLTTEYGFRATGEDLPLPTGDWSAASPWRWVRTIPAAEFLPLCRKIPFQWDFPRLAERPGKTA